MAAVIDMSEPSLDVSACLRRVRQQDEDAARALVSHLYPLVIKIVRSHLPRRMDADDLAQIVYGKMFAHLDQYAGNVPFEHWVSRIAVNTCLNELRAEKRRPELRWADLSEDEAVVLEQIVSVSAEPDPAQACAARELAEKMLAQLAPADRLVLTQIGRAHV